MRLSGLIPRLRRHVGQLAARGHGRIQRCRIAAHERLEAAACLRRIARLLVQHSGPLARLALHVGRFTRRLGDLLELGRRQRGAMRLAVGNGQLARDVGLQLGLREVRPEPLEHDDRLVPLFRADQQRGRIEIRIGADLRARRELGDAQEIVDGGGAVAVRALLFRLLVDRRREAIDDDGAFRVVVRHQRLGLAVRLFGGRIITLLKLRVRDDGPADPLFHAIHGRLQREQAARRIERTRVILRGVQVLRRMHQDRGALRVRRIGRGELQRALDALGVDRGARRRLDALLVLAIGDDRGIAGIGGLRRRLVAVGGLLVFLGRGQVLAAFEQRVGQQVIRQRRIRVVRERRQRAAVPLCSLLVVADRLGALRDRVIVRREIMQVGLQFRDNLGLVRRVAALPVRRAERIVIDELALTLQH